MPLKISNIIATDIFKMLTLVAVDLESRGNV